MTRSFLIPKAMLWFGMASYAAGSAVAVYGEYLGRDAPSWEMTKEFIIHGYLPLHAAAVTSFICAGLYVRYVHHRLNTQDGARAEEQASGQNQGQSLDAKLVG